MTRKSRNGQLLLNEAEASLQIGQVFGMKCNGNEEEVLSKLMELEVKDKEKLASKSGKAD